MASCAALFASPATSFSKTIEFRSKAPNRGIQLTDDPAPGVKGTIKFRLNADDRKTRAIVREQEALLADADSRTEAATRADQRILAIQQLLADVQQDEERLRAEINKRMIDRYKTGDDGDLEFLFSSKGMSDLVNRGRMLNQQSARDKRTIDEYEVTLARIRLYEDILEDLRDFNGDRARDLQERADRIDDVLVASKVGHDEATDADAKKPKGAGGSWFVMDGAFTAQLFLPNAGLGWGGGTRTPARKPTQAQIAMVLSDKRIDLDASGYQDVLTGQIDGRILDAMVAAAQRFNYIRITSLKGDHGVYTASGNVSQHSYGCAMDIGTIGSTYITPSSQVPGGEVNAAVVFFAGLGALKPDLAPHQVISLFDLGGATLAMSDHDDHIHVGYSC